jgi:hypothetical protein
MLVAAEGAAWAMVDQSGMTMLLTVVEAVGRDGRAVPVEVTVTVL